MTRQPRSARQIEKEAAIRKAYDALRDERDKTTKARIYSHEYCLAKVAERFYYSTRTVECIINGWGNYKREG